MKSEKHKSPRRTRGFERANSLLATRIRQAGEKRGFAVARLLTHWSEIVGADLAAVAKPVKVGYAKGGFGATLTVLTTGSQAPMLAMQKEKLREKVNACYGYSAISRVVITQTAPTGFAEGQVAFQPAPKAPNKPGAGAAAKAKHAAESIEDKGLRAALETLGRNVLSRTKSN